MHIGEFKPFVCYVALRVFLNLNTGSVFDPETKLKFEQNQISDIVPMFRE